MRVIRLVEDHMIMVFFKKNGGIGCALRIIHSVDIYFTEVCLGGSKFKSSLQHQPHRTGIGQQQYWIWCCLIQCIGWCWHKPHLFGPRYKHVPPWWDMLGSDFIGLWWVNYRGFNYRVAIMFQENVRLLQALNIRDICLEESDHCENFISTSPSEVATSRCEATWQRECSGSLGPVTMLQKKLSWRKTELQIELPLAVMKHGWGIKARSSITGGFSSKAFWKTWRS